jgi:hypothetical protein
VVKSINESQQKYLLSKPDVVFFDSNGKPILLIEVVATHKVSTEKKVKLKRLGIDSIQIAIPKDSPENIEKTFRITERTKWIYSHEQENTPYIPIPFSDSTAILSVDEDQRKLLEESFICRKAEINNLIRTIRRCLESKQYSIHFR